MSMINFLSEGCLTKLKTTLYIKHPGLEKRWLLHCNVARSLYQIADEFCIDLPLLVINCGYYDLLRNSHTLTIYRVKLFSCHWH